MRLIVAASALLLLAGCGTIPASGDPSPEFAVAGLGAGVQGAPAVSTVMAKANAICTGGAEKLSEEALPAEGGQFLNWRVKCPTYKPSFGF